MKRSTVRERLLASTIIGGATLVAISAAPAFAADEPASTTVQEVVVTGSRIPHPNLTSVSPLTTVNDQDIKLQGTQNIEDMINSLPQAFADFGAMQSNGASGTATIDLRGLGDKRTLILIDGKRMQPGDPGLPVPDINMIPTALVDRIDIVTGGASAVYGSDAVAGVVNFIMKKDFEGIRIDAQYGIDQHTQHNQHIDKAIADPSSVPVNTPTGSIWDGKRESVTLVAGANGADGRANVTAYFNYQHTDPVLEAARDFTACGLSTDSHNTTHQFCGGSSTSFPGRYTSPGGDFGIDSSGVVHPFGSQPTDVYNFAPLNYLQRPDERWTAGEFSHYQVNEHLDVYSSFMFMHDNSFAQIAGSGAFYGTNYQINCANPLLTSSEATAFCGANAGVDTLQDILIGRRDVEGVGRVSWLQHFDYRYVVGARGEIADGWNYDVYAQYGTSILQEQELGYFSIAKTNNALNVIDVGGVPTCKSVIDGTDPSCVPWNIFNKPGTGGVTAAQLKYLEENALEDGSTNEQIVSANINGDLGKYGVKSPWAKDGVGISLGAEYRREALNITFDGAFSSGDLAGLGGAPQNNSGAFDVKELFGEIRVPLIQDMAFAKELSFEGGFRHSDYSASGGVNSYKAALDWQIIPDIRLRGSIQRAVRAPNVNELFAPSAPGLAAGTDPCAGDMTLPGSPTAAQCANTGVTAAEYGHITQCISAQCSAVFSGNPQLKPEESDTKSFGAVFTPTFLPGFSLTVDWFDIRVNKVIQTLPLSVVMNNCLASATASYGAGTYCSLINRVPQTASVGAGNLFGDGFVNLPLVNAGLLHTSGIDLQADYRVRLSDWHLGDYGSLAFNLVGTKLDKLTTVEPDGSSYDCAGLFGTTCGVPNATWRSKFRISWITPWNVTASLQWRYISATGLDLNQTNPVIGVGPGFDSADSHTPGMSYFDLSGQWKIKDGLVLRAGVNNLFDRDPPIFDSNTFGISAPAFGNGNTYPQLYDSLGRTMFVSITADF